MCRNFAGASVSCSRTASFSRISASGRICCSGDGSRRARKGRLPSNPWSRRLASARCWRASRRDSLEGRSSGWRSGGRSLPRRTSSCWAHRLRASPKILLMDEPLASLDQERKLEILPLIERLRDEFRIPIVYVSHSVEEVGRLASRVVVLDAGRVVAVGGVEEVLGAGLSAAGISRFARSSVIAGKLTG